LGLRESSFGMSFRSVCFHRFNRLLSTQCSLYLIVGTRNRHGHTGITLAMEEKPVIEIWVQKIAEWFQYVALNREN